jgi:hypothetical protein
MSFYRNIYRMQGITGVVPRETPHIYGKPPLTIPKKMGTEFTVPAKFFSPDKEVRCVSLFISLLRVFHQRMFS